MLDIVSVCCAGCCGLHGWYLKKRIFTPINSDKKVRKKQETEAERLANLNKKKKQQQLNMITESKCICLPSEFLERIYLDRFTLLE